jgi:hypothetical protein
MKVLLTIVVLVVTGMSARADTVGLMSDEAANLVLINADSLARLPKIDGFSLQAPSFGTSSQTYGISFLNPRGFTGDTFEVTIANTYQSSLSFQIALNGILSNAQSINSGNSYTFSMSVPWGGANNFTMTITGVGAIDRGGFSIQSVREPASMLLLGSGLITLGAAVRWQLKRTRGFSVG